MRKLPYNAVLEVTNENDEKIIMSDGFAKIITRDGYKITKIFATPVFGGIKRGGSLADPPP